MSGSEGIPFFGCSKDKIGVRVYARRLRFLVESSFGG
jgi:hypothetical protein